MADLSACRQGLVTNLEAIDGLQVSAYLLSNPTFPTAMVLSGPIEFDKSFQRGLDSLVFLVRVLVGGVGDIGPGVNLDAYLAGSGPRSIKQAIETDRKLGGACDDLRVTGTEGELVWTFEGMPPALGAQWRVEVYG